MPQNHPLSNEQLSEIKENFAFFDRDNNGQIDLDEFTQLLKILSPESTFAQAESGFELVDDNQDGHIDFDEFIDWWRSCWWEY